MRIVEVINSFCGRGGAEVFLSALIEELAAQGHQILIVSLYDKIDSSFLYLKEIKNVCFATCFKKGAIDFSAAKRFKKIVSDFKPDTVHLHLSCLLTYFLAFHFKKQKWTLVETIHSIPGSNLNKIQEIIRKKFIKKKLINFVGISKSISSIMVDRYKCKCYTINNGIKLNTCENLCPIENRKYNFIIVANFTLVKNHSLLIKTFSKIVQEYPKLTLLCLGSGPTERENKELVFKLNLENNVIFAGKQTNVGSFLNESKFFVLSSHIEGNPISLLESLSFGLIPIVPEVGGIPDIVDSNNGFLYATDSMDMLYYSFKKALCLNDEQLSKISKHNIEYSKQFSISNCTDEYIVFFNSIKRSF